MRKGIWSSLGLASLSLNLLLAACGDDDDDASGDCALPAGAETSSACESCVRASCSGEYSSFCSSGCAASDTSSTCQQAVGQVLACVLANCADECATTGSTGGTGSVDGSAGAAGASEPGFACYVQDQGLCSAAAVTASTRGAYETACADSGGVIREICPTEELIGCCTYAGGTQTCVYETTAPPLERDSCNKSGGSWGEPG